MNDTNNENSDNKDDAEYCNLMTSNPFNQQETAESSVDPDIFASVRTNSTDPSSAHLHYHSDNYDYSSLDETKEEKETISKTLTQSNINQYLDLIQQTETDTDDESKHSEKERKHTKREPEINLLDNLFDMDPIDQSTAETSLSDSTNDNENSEIQEFLHDSDESHDATVQSDSNSDSPSPSDSSHSRHLDTLDTAINGENDKFSIDDDINVSNPAAIKSNSKQRKHQKQSKSNTHQMKTTHATPINDEQAKSEQKEQKEEKEEKEEKQIKYDDIDLPEEEKEKIRQQVLNQNQQPNPQAIQHVLNQNSKRKRTRQQKWHKKWPKQPTYPEQREIKTIKFTKRNQQHPPRHPDVYAPLNPPPQPMPPRLGDYNINENIPTPETSPAPTSDEEDDDYYNSHYDENDTYEEEEDEDNDDNHYIGNIETISNMNRINNNDNLNNNNDNDNDTSTFIDVSMRNYHHRQPINIYRNNNNNNNDENEEKIRERERERNNLQELNRITYNHRTNAERFHITNHNHLIRMTVNLRNDQVLRIVRDNNHLTAYLDSEARSPRPNNSNNN